MYTFDTMFKSVVSLRTSKLISTLIRRCNTDYCKEDKKKTKCLKPKRKGLILGIKSGPNLELSQVGCCINNRTSGRLLRSLTTASGGNIKEGKAYTLINIDKTYNAITVVGLQDPENKENDDELENIDSAKESVRVAVGVGFKAMEDLNIDHVEIESMGDTEATAEGVYLTSYKYQKNRFDKRQTPTIELYNDDDESICNWDRGKIKANAQNWARQLMNIPANQMTPKIFAKAVRTTLEEFCVGVITRNEDWMKEKCMCSFLSVSKGSKEKPCFLEIHYEGDKDDETKPIVLVGKGVTFDSGGICIKPSFEMDEMRADMGGAACIVGAIYALAALKSPVNIVALIPLTENLPSGSASKPGDIVFAMNGKSICIENTDCEGRMILADALCYSKQFKPEFILDVATLTGAMLVNLGTAAAGVYSNNNKLFQCLQNASKKTGDRIWRMPLWKHYTKQISKYELYDLNNLGRPGGGGSNTAAAFLREFVPENTPWIHMDMYNVLQSVNIPYLPDKGMSGRPTRTIIEFISSYKCECKCK